MDTPDLKLTSIYVPMADGARLAVDVWRPQTQAATQIPAVLSTTRYWRTAAGVEISKQRGFQWIKTFAAMGIASVVADARGTGASFGFRDGSFCSQEVDDIAALIRWIAAQAWCNGRVVSFGTSFSGNTALLAVASGDQHLKAVLSRFPDFDIFHHNLCPGGIANIGLNEPWGKLTQSLDQGINPANGGQSAKVRPVDEDADGIVLAEAIAEHAGNFDYLRATNQHLTYYDRLPDGVPGIPFHKMSVDAALPSPSGHFTPVYYWAGWYDAATAQGAIDFFKYYQAPKQVIIGPWNHGMMYHQDPLHTCAEPPVINFADKSAEVVPILTRHLIADEVTVPESSLKYYVLGACEWRHTTTWPVSGVCYENFYLGFSNTLSHQPSNAGGRDTYVWDATTTTGHNNRWTTQISGGMVVHDDRRQHNPPYLSYETPALKHPMEIIGNPMVELWLASSNQDGQLFVYLEVVLPSGEVRLLTEGCLRLLHRKVQWKDGLPFHHCLIEDSTPMPIGEAVRIDLALLPIAARLATGSKIRLSIAAHDTGNFTTTSGDEPGSYTLYRGQDFPSALKLPLNTVSQ